VPLLRKILGNAGIEFADEYSSHSLRRGFASWATANGWDLKMLMEYVGWKDVQSAMRYVEGSDPFGKARIETSLQATTTQPQLTD
jgi:integrase